MKPDIFEFIPDNTMFGMDQLIKIMLKSKSPITKYDLKEYWLDIGRLSDYEKAQKEFNDNMKNEL